VRSSLNSGAGAPPLPGSAPASARSPRPPLPASLPAGCGGPPSHHYVYATDAQGPPSFRLPSSSRGRLHLQNSPPRFGVMTLASPLRGPDRSESWRLLSSLCAAEWYQPLLSRRNVRPPAARRGVSPRLAAALGYLPIRLHFSGRTVRAHVAEVAQPLTEGLTVDELSSRSLPYSSAFRWLLRLRAPRRSPVGWPRCSMADPSVLRP